MSFVVIDVVVVVVVAGVVVIDAAKVRRRQERTSRGNALLVCAATVGTGRRPLFSFLFRHVDPVLDTTVNGPDVCIFDSFLVFA